MKIVSNVINISVTPLKRLTGGICVVSHETG
jgi:hypothetical protein